MFNINRDFFRQGKAQHHSQAPSAPPNKIPRQVSLSPNAVARAESSTLKVRHFEFAPLLSINPPTKLSDIWMKTVEITPTISFPRCLPYGLRNMSLCFVPTQMDTPNL